MKCSKDIYILLMELESLIKNTLKIPKQIGII